MIRAYHAGRFAEIDRLLHTSQELGPLRWRRLTAVLGTVPGLLEYIVTWQQREEVRLREEARQLTAYLAWIDQEMARWKARETAGKCACCGLDLGSAGPESQLCVRCRAMACWPGHVRCGRVLQEPEEIPPPRPD